MSSEGYCTWSVCVSVDAYSRTTGYKATSAELREPEKLLGVFPEMTAFESERLARLRTGLHGPTHQLAVRMRIYTFEMYGTADHDCDSDQVRSLCVS